MRDRTDTTALMLVSVLPEMTSLLKLIELKADLEVRNNKGETALMNAARCNNIDVMQVLIENKASYLDCSPQRSLCDVMIWAVDGEIVDISE